MTYSLTHLHIWTKSKNRALSTTTIETHPKWSSKSRSSKVNAKGARSRITIVTGSFFVSPVPSPPMMESSQSGSVSGDGFSTYDSASVSSNANYISASGSESSQVLV